MKILFALLFSFVASIGPSTTFAVGRPQSGRGGANSYVPRRNAANTNTQSQARNTTASVSVNKIIPTTTPHDDEPTVPDTPEIITEPEQQIAETVNITTVAAEPPVDDSTTEETLTDAELDQIIGELTSAMDTLRDEIQTLDSEMSRCHKSQRTAKTVGIIGAVGALGSGVGAIVQSMKIKSLEKDGATIAETNESDKDANK